MIKPEIKIGDYVSFRVDGEDIQAKKHYEVVAVENYFVTVIDDNGDENDMDIDKILSVDSNNKLKNKIMYNIKEALKSKKQKQYEKYILDEEGNLDLNSDFVQQFLFELMEDSGLEEAVNKYDIKVKAEEKKAKEK